MIGLLGAAIGLATSLNVGSIVAVGAFSDATNAPDVKVTQVQWNPQVSPGDPSLLNNVQVTFERIVGGGIINFDAYVSLSDSGGAQLGSVKAVHDVATGLDGGPVTQPFNFFGDNIALSDIFFFEIILCDHVSGDSDGVCK